MKKFFVSIILLFIASTAVHAQIGMKISAQHERYLRYERIQMKLQLRNYSGNTLIFGKDAQGQNLGRLVFKVTAQNGNLVSMLDPAANPMDGMVFGAGESRELTLTLNALFDLQVDGFYTVTAYIDHKRLPQGFASNTLNFEVRDGSLVATKTIGLPTENNSDAIKSVAASLMRFNDGKREIFCLRIEDENCVYGTFRVGPYIAGREPQLDADGTSAIHVFIQVAPKLYSYAVYSIIGGEAKIRQQRYFVPENGVPMLSRTTGYFKVLYARQAVEGVDFKFQTVEDWN
ncbi:MAG: hypothetical protein IJT83_07600 [Victivallales bacterium]|nr:hypothetical protein [Victivallales bacterium]